MNRLVLPLMAATLGYPGTLWPQVDSPKSEWTHACPRGRIVPVQGGDSARVAVNVGLSGNYFWEHFYG